MAAYRFTRDLIIEGVESIDGRFVMPGATVWRPAPLTLPLMYVPTLKLTGSARRDLDTHGIAARVGRITALERDGWAVVAACELDDVSIFDSTFDIIRDLRRRVEHVNLGADCVVNLSTVVGGQLRIQAMAVMGATIVDPEVPFAWGSEFGHTARRREPGARRGSPPVPRRTDRRCS